MERVTLRNYGPKIRIIIGRKPLEGKGLQNWKFLKSNPKEFKNPRGIPFKEVGLLKGIKRREE